jgi:nucleoside-diphosphate-sugar epimerase
MPARESALEGVVPQLGFLYGPGVPSAEFMLAMLRRRMMAMPRCGQAVVPWVEIGDAVAAFGAALERGRGGEIYNVVDDQSVTIAEFLAELPRVSSAPGPYGMPRWLARLAMPAGAELLGCTTLRVSNAKAKRLLGWTPAHHSYRTGLRHWHQQLIRNTQ